MASITFLPLPAPVVKGGSSPQEPTGKDAPAGSSSQDQFIKTPPTAAPVISIPVAGSQWTHPSAAFLKSDGLQAFAGPGDVDEIRFSSPPFEGAEVITRWSELEEIWKTPRYRINMPYLIALLPDGSYSLRILRQKSLADFSHLMDVRTEKLVSCGLVANIKKLSGRVGERLKETFSLPGGGYLRLHPARSDLPLAGDHGDEIALRIFRLLSGFPTQAGEAIPTAISLSGASSPDSARVDAPPRLGGGPMTGVEREALANFLATQRRAMPPPAPAAVAVAPAGNLVPLPHSAGFQREVLRQQIASILSQIPKLPEWRRQTTNPNDPYNDLVQLYNMTRPGLTMGLAQVQRVTSLLERVIPRLDSHLTTQVEILQSQLAVLRPLGVSDEKVEIRKESRGEIKPQGNPEDIRTYAASAEFNPELFLDKIAALYPELAPYWETITAFGELQTLRQHTLLVLKQFEKYEAPHWDAATMKMSVGLMRALLALHDLSKAMALAQGEKVEPGANEWKFTEILKKAGYGDEQIQRAVVLLGSKLSQYVAGHRMLHRLKQASDNQLFKTVDENTNWLNFNRGTFKSNFSFLNIDWEALVKNKQGEVDYVKAQLMLHASEELRKNAQASGLPPSEFLRLKMAYYRADAGAYTTAASGAFQLVGVSAFDDLFIYYLPRHSVAFTEPVYTAVDELTKMALGLDKTMEVEARAGVYAGAGDVDGPAAYGKPVNMLAYSAGVLVEGAALLAPVSSQMTRGHLNVGQYAVLVQAQPQKQEIAEEPPWDASFEMTRQKLNEALVYLSRANWEGQNGLRLELLEYGNTVLAQHNRSALIQIQLALQERGLAFDELGFARALCWVRNNYDVPMEIIGAKPVWGRGGAWAPVPATQFPAGRVVPITQPVVTPVR